MDDKHNLNEPLSEKAQFLLNGRIYPALEACVNNRYKIIVSFFVFYSFILNPQLKFINDNYHLVSLLGSIVFTIFIVHNCINYVMNAHEELILENRDYLGNWFKNSIIEFLFLLIMCALIWGMFGFIKK